MAVVGTAFVDIQAVGSAFGKQLEGQFSGFGKKAIAAMGLTLGAAELVKFGKESVQAFETAQAAEVKFQNAFRIFPALANVTEASFAKLNQSIQDHTGFLKSDLQLGEANLAQFKLTGSQIQQIIPLVVDYATKTGQDVPSAATNLGRAFLGNTRALKAIGIQFKATGDTTKDFNTIAGLLQAKVGGLADAMGKTATGQAKILGAQFEDLKIEIGSKILPILVKVEGFILHDIIPVLKTFGEFLGSNTGKLILFGGGVLYAATKIEQMAVAIKAANVAAGTGIFAKLVKIFEGIGGAATVSVAAMGALGSVTSNVTNAATGLTDRATSLEAAVRKLGTAADASQLKAFGDSLAANGVSAAELNMVFNDLNAKGLHPLSLELAAAAKNAGFVITGLDGAGSSARALGEKVQQSGTKVLRFADMTAKDITAWQKTIHDNLVQAGDAFGTIANKAHITSRDIVKAFDDAAKNSTLYNIELRKIAAENIPDELKKQVIEQANGSGRALQAFADLSASQRERVVKDFLKIQAELHNSTYHVDELSNHLRHVPDVTVHFTMANLARAISDARKLGSILNNLGAQGVSQSDVVNQGGSGSGGGAFGSGSQGPSYSRAMGGGASGGVGSGNIEIHIDGQVIGEILAPEFMRALDAAVRGGLHR